MVDFILSGLESIHVRLSEDDVRVLISWSFPDIWVINANNEGFSFFDGDSVDSGDRLKSHLGHGLLELLFSSVGFGVKVFIVVIVAIVFVFMIAVFSVGVFGFLLCGLSF